MNSPLPKPTVLALAGARYNVAEVLQKSKMAPPVSIKVSDLWPAMPGTQFPELIVTIENGPAPAVNTPILFKQQGKFTVLLGESCIVRDADDPNYKGEIKGVLMSSPLLKKTRIDENPGAYEQPTPVDSDFRQQLSPSERYAGARARGAYYDRDNANVTNRPRFRQSDPRDNGR